MGIEARMGKRRTGRLWLVGAIVLVAASGATLQAQQDQERILEHRIACETRDELAGRTTPVARTPDPSDPDVNPLPTGTLTLGQVYAEPGQPTRVTAADPQLEACGYIPGGRKWRIPGANPGELPSGP